MQFLSSKEAADFLAVSEPSLRSMRSIGIGPPYHREGRSVRYRRNDLETYVAGLSRAASARRENRIARMNERGASAD